MATVTKKSKTNNKPIADAILILIVTIGAVSIFGLHAANNIYNKYAQIQRVIRFQSEEIGTLERDAKHLYDIIGSHAERIYCLENPKFKDCK